MSMVRIKESTGSFASPGLRSETPLAAGGGVIVRAALAEDTEPLGRMLCRCSMESIRLRFHSPFRCVPRRILRGLAAVDSNLGRAIIAEVEGEIVGHAVGHAMYVRYGEGAREAEVAAIVEDEWSSRGIGQFLLKEISTQAMEDGIEMLICAALGENYRVRDLARRTFPDARVSIYGGMRVMHLPLTTGVAQPDGRRLAASPLLPDNAYPSRFIDQGEVL